jgi:endo-1,3-1,4-beta-glycanase ExoK
MHRPVASLLTLGLFFGVGCSGTSRPGGASGATTGQPASGSSEAGSGVGAGASGSANSGGASTGSSTGVSAGSSGSSAGSSGLSAGSSGASAGSSGSCDTAAIAGVIGHPDACINYPTRPGYNLYLAEEFEQPIDLDNDPNWTWSDGGLSEGQVRFIQSQIKFAGGNMQIITEKVAQPTGMSYAENSTIGPEPLSSGEFRTKYNNYRYGWYEARYKPPTSTGNFISTLFAFRTPKSIAWREIDNELTANGLNVLGTNVYWQNNAGNYVCDYADQLDVTLPGVTDILSDFHVFAFEWAPTYVKWYVDDMTHPVRTKTATDIVMNCPGSVFTVNIPELSAKILMNLWVFAAANGYGGNDPQKNTYPMTATYDYVRFYKAATGEDTYPCSPTPSCIAHSDIILSKNNPDDGVPYNTN